MIWLKRALVILVLLVIAGIGYYQYDTPDRMSKAMLEALAALGSDTDVIVTENEWIVFSPAESSATTGLIFYPGGDCDPRGYAEPLREIAASGVLVVLVPMQLNLAVFAPDSADKVVAAFPGIKTWAIAGHSLGGSMAARYVFSHPDAMDGLLLWDAYSPDDLTDRKLAVKLIHRSDTSGATPEDYAPHLANFPPQTTYMPLAGANHLNFGDFIAGRMYRDEPPAELDSEQHQKLAAAGTIEFLNSLEAR